MGFASNNPVIRECLICISHSWGGLEQVVATDAIEHFTRGIDTRVICLEGTPIQEQLEKSSKVPLVKLDFRPRDHFDLKFKKVLEEQIAQGVNVFHVHQPSLLGSVVPWLWNKKRVALFASRHIMNAHSKRGLYHRVLYSRVDGVLAMSESLRANILSTHSIPEAKVEVVNLGLDFQRFHPDRVDAKRQRAEWGADDEHTLIGLVGRIDPAKGQSTFIKAAAGLTTALSKEKIRFVMVGEETLGRTGEYLDELRQLVAQFRLEDRIVFAGYKENIPEVMAAIDILVMPSKQEAFGLVAIEAMAMECPIVISRGGSAPEIVGDQEFGLLCRPEDSFDLQQQLKYLLTHRDRWMEMGKRAREHVLKHYSRDSRVERTLKIFERALNERSKLSLS